ncbi:MAG: CAP domain-containing protein [Chloroflexi bacterium]|nr:CAP domain-containing protein [Chloroflexota bacterium]
MGCALTIFPLRAHASQYAIRAILGCALFVMWWSFALPRADAQSANVTADLLARINRERVARGLAPLALNASLTAAAQNHANDVVNSGKYGHVGSDGSMAADRAARAGYGAYSWGRRIGENWANYRDTATAFAMWMESAPHRGNILHPLYRELGIGVAPTTIGTFVYVLVFGAQPNVLPVFINDGAPRTTDLNVRLTLTTDEVAPAGDGANIGKPTEVQISNASNFAGASWQPFASPIKWTLAEDASTKTVYVKYRDAKGRTATSSASIAFGASNDAPAGRAPAAQIAATSTRDVTATPRATATLTRTATRAPATSTVTATATIAPTETSSPTPTDSPTETATWTPMPSPTITPFVVTATPESRAETTDANQLPDPVALGAFGIGVMLGVLALVNRLANRIL